jgi:hypothetical protein
MQETLVGGSWSKARFMQNGHYTLSKTKAKRAEGVPQVVECSA